MTSKLFSRKRMVLLLAVLMIGLLSVVSFWGNQKAAAFEKPDLLPEPVLYRTAPGDLPRFEVVTGPGTPGEGLIFMSPFAFANVGRSPSYLLILDNKGEPVFYRRLPTVPNAMDFKLQPNGLLTYYDRRQMVHVALNDQYEVARTYMAGNGYTADLHDLQLLDNGHLLFLIYDVQTVDMSARVEGGYADAQVTACIIQEVDEQGNVVFEWHGLDHIDILDSSVEFTTRQINYMNCNSVQEDEDGNLLLSSRNLQEITKIDRQTGDIIWRMGGKKNEFSFLNGGEFFLQHDARRLPNGHMTIYDNGIFHVPPHSRGLEVLVDEVNKTVIVVREFRTDPDAVAGAMGNLQRLPNGNTVIGWGRSSQPVFSEYDNKGMRILEFSAVQNVGSYRVFRFPWRGFPNWPPAVIGDAVDRQVELFFSWNGSTETAGYMIFAAQKPGQEWHVTTVAKTGFETAYKFTVPQYGLWDFWVVALDQDLQPLKESNHYRMIVGGHQVYLPVVNWD